MKNSLNTIIQGDTLQVLKKLEANFVDLSITSPPYNKQENRKAGS